MADAAKGAKIFKVSRKRGGGGERGSATYARGVA